MNVLFDQATHARSIYLSDDMLRDPEKLHVFLSDLYLGPATTYSLEFNSKYLLKINRIFDYIILRYGYTAVSFTFRTL